MLWNLHLMSTLHLWRTLTQAALCTPLFIIAVYLPSTSYYSEEYNEYLDILRALYDSVPKLFVILMGDINGNLSDFIAVRGNYKPNQRGSKLLEQAKSL